MPPKQNSKKGNQEFLFPAKHPETHKQDIDRKDIGICQSEECRRPEFTWTDIPGGK
jgi:hypothetical protein